MVVFSAIIAMLPVGAGWGAVTIFGLNPAVSAAIIAAGRSALWSLAGAALTKPNVPSQQVQATLSQTDAPRIRVYGRNLLGGQRVFFEAEDGQLLQIVVCAHGRVDGLVQFWWDGEPVETDPDGRVHRYKYNYFRDGSGIGGDYSEVLSRFPALWTTAHRLQGQTTFCTKFGDPSDEDFAKVFPKGAYTVVQAEVRGSRVLNMAGASIYSENAGLCIRDLMTHADGWNIPVSRLDTASWQGFVNLCGQSVSLAAGGTEMRYRLCGFYSLDDALKDTTARMLATCDGQIYETAESQIGILGGQWSEPDVTITADDILSIEMTDGYDPFTDYNVLKGSFVSPLHAYQSTEVAELRDEASLATQEERVEQYDNDMVPSNGQMQRLMKIKMAKDHREHTGTIRTNLVGMKARFPKGDGIHTIRIVAEEFGLDGVFEVTSHSFDIPNGVCDIGIASIANPYGWTAAEEKPLPPTIDELGTPDHSLPALDPVLTQEIVGVSGDVQGVKVVVTVTDPERGDLELRAQIAPGTHGAEDVAAWTDMPAANYRAESSVLDDGATYTVRVRWRGRGAWEVAGVVTTIANPTIPAAPTDFGGTMVGLNVYLDWVNAPSDFWRTQIRRGITANFGDAVTIANVSGSAGQPYSYTDTSPPTGALVRYWAVTLNASGVQSTPAGPATVNT